MKRILILTVTAGEGHNSVANALRQYFTKDELYETKTIDLFKEYSSSLKQKTINEGYLFACKNFLSLYNFIYKQLEKLNPLNRYKTQAQGTVINETPKLLKDIYDFKPDIIITTHFYGSIMISNLRALYDIPAMTFSVLTDYGIHPFWESSIGIDYIITPTHGFEKSLEEKGYKKEQILPIGIPIKKEFYTIIDKKDARKELGVDNNMFTILLAFGGGGFIRNYFILKKLLKYNKPLQILVINGKNEKNKKKIDRLLKKSNTHHKVFNYGFVNNMFAIMAASDILIGKAGGISVTESLVQKLPLLLHTKLPHQEKYNMDYLVETGAALSFDNEKELMIKVDDLYRSPDILKELQDNAEKIRTNDTLERLKVIVDKAPKSKYGELLLSSKKDFSTIKKELKKHLKKAHKKEALKKRGCKC